MNLLRKSLKLNNKNFIVSTIGTIDNNRGQEVIIESIATLKRLIPNIILLIVGSGTSLELNRLKKIIKEKSLQSNIKLLGYREDAHDIISISDLIVNPVKNIESFGLVSIEAMVLKKPIISSRIGGVGEVLINKKTGLLIKPEDPVLLSKKILLLFNNKSLRMSLGKNGFDRYHKMFTVNQMCKEYYNLLI